MYWNVRRRNELHVRGCTTVLLNIYVGMLCGVPQIGINCSPLFCHTSAGFLRALITALVRVVKIRPVNTITGERSSPAHCESLIEHIHPSDWYNMLSTGLSA